MPSPDARRPTLIDVARLAGVSHMTVSRVVRGFHAVSPETARRVTEAINQLGYQPDPALSALASYRALGTGHRHGSTLAFLDCDSTDHSQKIFAAAQREGQLLGYSVERFPIVPEPARQQRMSRMLYNRGVQGLLFGPSPSPWKNLDAWDWSHFAPVSLGALAHSPHMPNVAMDHFHGALTGCHYLQDHGCQRIGLVLASWLMARTEYRWLGGYIAGLEGKGKARLCPPDDLAKLKQWALREKIDGVLTIHPEIYPVLHPLGITVGFLNSVSSVPGAPHLYFDPGWIGEEAVRLVHHLLLRREFGLDQKSKMMALQGTWVLQNPD